MLDGPWHALWGGGGGNKLVKLVPGVHNAVKSGFFELYFLFCLSRTHKFDFFRFLSLGSYLNMYHGYASLKKSTFCPFFTEKRAFFQHILRDAKSTKCELEEHLWERATRRHPPLPQLRCSCRPPQLASHDGSQRVSRDWAP